MKTVWAVEELVDKNTPVLVELYASKYAALEMLQKGYCGFIERNDGIVTFNKGTMDNHYGVFRLREVPVIGYN
jgi:hypothetical protein